ncbi:MAG: hypothetical protein ACLR76_09435 [Alistipes sp.]
MSEASEAMRFEEAAQYKKRIEILTSYQSKSVVVSNTLTNMDVFSLVTDEDAAFCNFMRIADGAVVNSFTVELKPGLEDTPRDVLTYAIGTIARAAVGQALARGNRPVPPSGSLWKTSRSPRLNGATSCACWNCRSATPGCTGSRNSSRSRSRTPPATRTAFSRRCNGSSA